MCHLQWPGMRLVWVPVLGPSHEGEGERERVDQSGGAGLGDEEVEEEEQEEEVEVEEEEADGAGEGQSEGEEAGDRTKKALFHHTLKAVISNNHRRRSDPGLHSLLKQHGPRSPPVPSKRTHSSLAQLGPPPGEDEEEEEEESIYESTLPTQTAPLATAAATSCRELDIPLIRVRKPQRRTKLSPSLSDPNSEFQPGPERTGAEDVAPPIPERVPMVPRGGGVALPQPTVQEWRTLRPLSPNRPAPSEPPPPTPVRSLATPPSSPMFQRRAPLLPPPRTDPRRLSSASSHSLTSMKGEQLSINLESPALHGDAVVSLAVGLLLLRTRGVERSSKDQPRCCSLH